jgi:YVTN family beta-propeller protein
MPVRPVPGAPANDLTESIDVCQTPSHITVHREVIDGAPGRPSRVASRVYVTCFLSNQIMVVDPDTAVVTDTILVGRGPNDLEFDDARQRAYVTNFSEMTIGVIDIRPGSETRNRMIARIGTPVSPQKP